jgi:Amt family ammonium transporter
MGYHDMAGSGVIHLNGAIGALVITYMLKPRRDRYNESKAHEFEPSNTLFIALATLSLYVCWIFFNAGSTLGISDGKAYILGRTACNTLISGASGGITVMILHYYLNKENIKNKFSLVMLCNGNLAGLVAVTGYNYKL